MKLLSEVFAEIDSLFQRQAESAYRDFRDTVYSGSSVSSTSLDLEDDFLFGDTITWRKPQEEPAVKERVIVNTVYANRPAPSSGVTYDPTHANWIGREVLAGLKFDVHSPGVISAKLS